MTSASSTAPHTVLVHGLGRSRFDMFLLKPRLEKLIPSTSVHVFDYQSRKLTIREIAKQLATFTDHYTRGAPVSFVGHSLGGLIVRALDKEHLCSSSLHRLVTLGTPHNGASIARFLVQFGLSHKVFGPVLREIGTFDGSFPPNSLQVGCILGGTKTRVGFYPFAGQDNDGIVLASEALLAQAVDSITIPVLHALMPFSSSAATLSASFLTRGSFYR